jgi:hypothetical protein
MVLTTACASGGTPDPTGALTTRESNVITYGEITQAQGLMTAWDAVQRLRPRFLRNAGRSSLGGSGDNRAIVRIDESDSGAPEVLRTIEIQFVMEIRYYSAVDATSRFGGRHGRGVIHVITKTRT